MLENRDEKQEERKAEEREARRQETMLELAADRAEGKPDFEDE